MKFNQKLKISDCNTSLTEEQVQRQVSAEEELVDLLEQSAASESHWMKLINRIFAIFGYRRANSIDIYLTCKDYNSLQDLLVGHESGYLELFVAVAIKQICQEFGSDLEPVKLEVDKGQLSSAAAYFHSWFLFI